MIAASAIAPELAAEHLQAEDFDPFAEGYRCGIAYAWRAFVPFAALLALLAAIVGAAAYAAFH